jgi:hypothetical protein
MIRKLLLAPSLIIMLSVGSVEAQVQTVHYSWTAPTTGSAVHHYIVQHKIGDGAWISVASVVTLTYNLAATYLESHQIRVAGVDVLSRQGLWSEPSESYTPDAGAPGGCGQPVRY